VNGHELEASASPLRAGSGTLQADLEAPEEEVRMTARRAVLVALAAALTLTPIAASGHDTTKQRVSITTRGVTNSSRPAQFVLDPLQVGSLRRDSGTTRVVGSLPSERVVMRDGQRVAVFDPIVELLEGARGTLVIRSRIEYVDAGHGYHVGTGTWLVLRGTGQYARIGGAGRRGDVYLDRGPWSGRNEGFLAVR